MGIFLKYTNFLEIYPKKNQCPEGAGLCEIVWGSYGFAFVCEVGKSCMHCNVVLET